MRHDKITSHRFLRKFSIALQLEYRLALSSESKFQLCRVNQKIVRVDQPPRAPLLEA